MLSASQIEEYSRRAWKPCRCACPAHPALRQGSIHGSQLDLKNRYDDGT